MQQAKKEAVLETGQEVKQNNNNNRKESKKDKKAEKNGHQQNGGHTDNVTVLHLSEQVRRHYNYNKKLLLWHTGPVLHHREVVFTHC